MAVTSGYEHNYFDCYDGRIVMNYDRLTLLVLLVRIASLSQLGLFVARLKLEQLCLTQSALYLVLLSLASFVIYCFRSPLHLVATVNSCRGYPIWMSGAMFERDLTACILQVRVKDQSGIPLPEVSLTMAGSEPVVELTTPDPAPSVIMPNFKLMDQNTITDPYGRVWLMMSTAHTKNYFGVGRVVFAKPGFAAKGRV